MKRVISIILSIAMVLTMSAGLNLTVFAADVSGISFYNADGNNAISVYEGFSSFTETNSQGEEYYVYYLDGYSLVEEGNIISLDYSDGTTEEYECVRDYRNDEDYDLVFKCGNEIINPDDIEIITNQDDSHRWTLYNTYTAEIDYRGVSCALNVSIVENPVTSVEVYYDRPITLVENANGFLADDNGDEWFFYFANNLYLNYAGVRFVVDYANGDTEVFEYEGNDWLPKNDNGDTLEQRYLDFSFNQMREGNHFSAGDIGRTAKVKYYGKGIDNMPVTITNAEVLDSGSISLNDHRKVLFIGNEWHTVTITPQEDGVYVFEESLADKLIWERNRFEGDLLDENGDVVDSLSNEWMAYVLEGGETYTLKARKIEDSGPIFEFLHVKNVTSAPVSINFIPRWDYYNFYDGNLATDEPLYTMGNQLEVEFSDGDVKTFYCNNIGEYRYYSDEYGNEGIKLWDYANEKGIDFDRELRCNIDTKCWEKGGENNYLEIYFGTAYQRYYVDDYIQDSPYQSISLNGTPVTTYEGTSHTDNGHNSNGEWVDYQRYDINRWDLEIEGNTLTVTYLDGTEKTYTCVRDEEWGYLEFRSYHDDDDGYDSIWTEELFVDSNQNPDNEWEFGGTYSIDVYFGGQKTTFNAQVVESPVDYIYIDTTKNIEVFENCNGHWEYDDRTDSDYFRYDEAYDYLRATDAVITIHFKDGEDKVYDYHNHDWLPCDENDERINERYFEFYFDQGDNHFERGANNKAYVKYYGVPVELNVNVNATHAVDDGELSENNAKPIIFLNREQHHFTFTPSANGKYEFNESLAEQVKHNGGEFEFELTDSDGEEVQRIDDNDCLVYNLTAGEEYTVTTRMNRDGISLEYIEVRQCLTVKKIEYTYLGDSINVFEGDSGEGRELYENGSMIKITFSDNSFETFTVNEWGEFENNDGRKIWEYADEKEVYGDREFRITPSVSRWTNDGSSAYYTISFGGKSTKVYVTVNASVVESIRYNRVNYASLIKGVDFSYDDGANEFTLYDVPFFEGDTIDVTYNDGRGTITYNYEWDNRFYYDTHSDAGWQYIYVNYSFDDSHDYDYGDEIEFTVNYQTASTAFSTEVVENDVDFIEFTPAKPISIIKEKDGYWRRIDEDDDENDIHIHEDYFNYDHPSIYRLGNIISVHYTDGTSADFEYNGRYFMDEDGNRLLNRYISTVSWQENNHWTVGDENDFGVRYKGMDAITTLTVVDPGEWELNAYAHDSRGITYEDGDTLYIERGQKVFIYFDSDFRNREHDIADIIGFSDGFDGGTLSSRGFDVQTGNDNWFGYDFDNQYGLLLGTYNLRVGTRGVLNYYLYQGTDYDYNNFDFVNTPIAATYTLNVEIVEHTFVEDNIVPATCTTKGYTEYTCETCGITYRSDFTDFAEHEYIETETVATPNAKGYTTYSCVNCDYEYIGNITGYASDDEALSAVVSNSSCLEAADYSLDSFSALSDAIEAADSIKAGDNPQVEIDNATTEILSAITDLQPYLIFSAEAENGTVTQNVPNGTYLQGEEIALTAAPDSGYTFGGWYEKGTKRIFSYDSTYTFVLTSNTEFVALFTPSGENNLVFTNKTGQIVETVSKTAAEWQEVSDIESIAPAVPYSYGCTNGAWVIPAGTLSALQGGESVIITPSYDESAAFVPEAHAEGNTPALNLYYTYDSSNTVGSFVMAVDIPDGVRVESIGTAFCYKKAANFDPTQFILTVNNKTATSKFDDNRSGVYVTNMNKMSSYYNWAVRGYVNYYDSHGNLKTAYSNQINIIDRAQV